LLLGLLYDHTGQRYTLSHTVHHTKRYRYYVAQRPQQTQTAGPVRIPALELETLVLQRLQQLLNDQLALLDALSVPGDDAALLQALLNSARARGQAWPKLAPEQVRQFVRAVVMRITVALDTWSLRSTKAPCAAHCYLGQAPRLSRLRLISSSSASTRVSSVAAARCAWS